MRQMFLLFFLFFSTVFLAAQPDWAARPADFDYNMALLGVIIFDGEESVDPDDMVAAFVGDVCRGVAKPSLFPLTGRYTFGMTIYGSMSGEKLVFKAYDASQDQMFDIEETYHYEIDGVIGDDMNPEELHAVIEGGYVLTVNIDPLDGGTTTPEAGSHFYKQGDVVDLSAQPAADYEFVKWSGDVANSMNSRTTVTMDFDKTVTAHFARMTHQLTMVVAPENAGTVIPAEGSHEYNAGEVVSISAEPAEGYYFSDWIGGVEEPTNPTTTVTMDEDKVIIARFKLLTYNLNMQVQPEEGGTTEPPAGEHSYPRDEVVDISATPAEGYKFLEWQGDVDDATAQSTSVLLNSNKSVTAVFEEIQPEMVTLAISADPADGGTTTPAPGSYNFQVNTIVQISATAESGYIFDKWEGDVEDAASAVTTVRMQESKEVVAIFKTESSVRADASPPTEYALGQNYPNPFNGVTRIQFSVPTQTFVRLDIIDMNGKTVRQLVHGERGAGTYDVLWDGMDETGDLSATGIYMYRLNADDFRETKKLLLVK